MMIDDDADFREIVVTKLAKEGFNLIQAENGEEGIKKAKEVKPDLVLLDVKMPKMTGMEALAKMREDKELANMKVFFLTNLGGEKDGEENNKFAKDIGALGYIRKTDDLDKIAEVVKSALVS